MVELAKQQQSELHGSQPAMVRDPVTGETFVLVRQDVYELLRKIIDGPNRRGWANPADDDLIKKLA